MSAGRFDPRIATMCRTSEALKRELRDLGADAGLLLVYEQRAWQSATFSGTRHRLTYAFDGAIAVERGEQLIDLLPYHEFEIPKQLVADAAVVAVEQRADPPRLVVDLELSLLDEA